MQSLGAKLARRGPLEPADQLEPKNSRHAHLRIFGDFPPSSPLEVCAGTGDRIKPTSTQRDRHWRSDHEDSGSARTRGESLCKLHLSSRVHARGMRFNHLTAEHNPQASVASFAPASLPVAPRNRSTTRLLPCPLPHKFFLQIENCSTANCFELISAFLPSSFDSKPLPSFASNLRSRLRGPEQVAQVCYQKSAIVLGSESLTVDDCRALRSANFVTPMSMSQSSGEHTSRRSLMSSAALLAGSILLGQTAGTSPASAKLDPRLPTPDDLTIYVGAG